MSSEFLETPFVLLEEEDATLELPEEKDATLEVPEEEDSTLEVPEEDTGEIVFGLMKFKTTS
jgi:hypothetical protein